MSVFAKLTTLPAAFKFFSRALSLWLPRAMMFGDTDTSVMRWKYRG